MSPATLHPEMLIASRMQATQLLTANSGRAVRHLISIGAPGDPVPAGFEQCALEICIFRDVVKLQRSTCTTSCSVMPVVSIAANE